MKSNLSYKNIVNVLLWSSVYLFTCLCMYIILFLYNKSKLYFLLPVFVLSAGFVVDKILKIQMNRKVNLISIIVSYFCLSIINGFERVFIENYPVILSVLVYIIFINVLFLCFFGNKNSVAEISNNYLSKDLFNLFYINTSKAHELAMLLDNKIMKRVEKEQISEELLKTTSLIDSKTNLVSGEISIQKEDNYKKRVYENFDVKMTKSIMLRELYEVAKLSSNKNLSSGQLILFRDVELEQRNINDTVMFLNICKDINLKNQGDENFEINVNKMLETMLDDFTIDYQFEHYISDNHQNEEFLIQLPYKSDENFENGYFHNDLQLGKLSIIGIYRGKIDFSKRESISSKFLEFFSEFSTQKKHGTDYDVMMDSEIIENSENYSFNFKINKLSKQMHLIDVVAIIQEVKFNRELENE